MRGGPCARLRVPLLVLLGATFLSGGAGLGAQGPAAPPAAARPHAPVCPGPAAPGTARCHAHLLLQPTGHPVVAATPQGYGPVDLASAYGLASGLPAPPAGCAAPTDYTGCPRVAVVDAYDNPTAESDLAVYRSTFGLPPCTSQNGCFRKVDQQGGTRYPRADQGWALESALDVQMVSAVCPYCRLLLVEARDNSWRNLTAAVQYAKQQGVQALSNSYGAPEWSGEGSLEATYQYGGGAVTASAGDSGYGVDYPAASQYVTAVGGTTLWRAATPRGWAEAVWSGTGSGCSTYLPKPSWQQDGGCARRTVADVALVADPTTGVAVYDSWGYQGYRGWFMVGGTSVGAPWIAGLFVRAGNAAQTGCAGGACYPYSHAAALWDIIQGQNGACGTYLCTAQAGYDGPTGLGTPNGTGGF